MHPLKRPRLVAAVLGLLMLAAIAATLISQPGPPRRLLARPLPPKMQGAGWGIPNEAGAILAFPVSGKVEEGVDYRYTLSTHCGLDRHIDFDGSLWDFSGPGTVDGGIESAPAGFNNPFDHGTMRLVSDDDAEFRSEQGLIVEYNRREGGKHIEMCM